LRAPQSDDRAVSEFEPALGIKQMRRRIDVGQRPGWPVSL
jgi:hypothetical protein